MFKVHSLYKAREIIFNFNLFIVVFSNKLHSGLILLSIFHFALGVFVSFSICKYFLENESAQHITYIIRVLRASDYYGAQCSPTERFNVTKLSITSLGKLLVRNFNVKKVFRVKMKTSKRSGCDFFLECYCFSIISKSEIVMIKMYVNYLNPYISTCITKLKVQFGNH